MRKLIGLLLLFLFLSGHVQADSFSNWADRVHEFSLSNGMKFLLYERGEAPIFSAYIRFRVGGIEEEPGQSGLAHFMEHMAFKGTEKIGPNELPRMMEQAGGADYNATTSKDMTSYFVSLPSDKLRFWAEIESERIFKPVFREFYEERDVVLEERRMRVDNDPDGKLYEIFLRTAFEKSPYRWPTIGLSEDLLKLSGPDLEKFWKKYYHPSRAVGVLVGKFDRKKVEKILQETFGKIGPPGSEDPPRRMEEPVQTRERKVRVSFPAKPRVMIGFHKPTLPHPDDTLFDLLDQIVGEGRSSRLYKSLVLEKRIASEVGTSTGIPGSRLPNLFMITANPLEGHSPEEVLKAIDEELEKVKREGVTDREFEKAKNRLTVNLLWKLKTNEGMASELSYFEMFAGGWRYLADYLIELSHFQPADVKRVAETYLVSSNRTVAILHP